MLLYIAKILARYPKDDKDLLYSLTFLEMAFQNDKVQKINTHREIGLDVARKGEDATVFTVREGNHKIYMDEQVGENRIDLVADRAMEICDEYEALIIKVDDTGVGGGVTDILIGKNYPVYPINFGQKPIIDPERYYDAKSEMHHHLRMKYRNQTICDYQIKNEKKLVQAMQMKTYLDPRKQKRRVLDVKNAPELFKRVKKKHSPDIMDSEGFAFYPIDIISPVTIIDDDIEYEWDSDPIHAGEFHDPIFN